MTPPEAMPPASVLTAFGAAGPLVPLPGGQRTAWRAGSIVLKPLDMSPEALEWQARLLRSLDGHRDSFRVSVPLAGEDGALIHAGWTAWRYEAGRSVQGAWHAILETAERLHAVLASVPRPTELRQRTDPWAVADRIAWGEEPPGAATGTPHLASLLGALEPLDAPNQLVHGDLGGNVLFAEGLAPLVLDFSPYWRPAPFASAIVIVDALVWQGGPPELLTAAGRGRDAAQFLRRALVFRLVSEHLQGHDPAVAAARYASTVALVTALAAAR